MEIGEYVVRKSYGRDITFKIIDIKEKKNKKIYKKVLTLCHISGILSLVARKQSCETEYAEVSELADEQD